MSFRRIPFQFSTTDPAERQRELEKRFGLPSQNKMYVDAANPLIMGHGVNTAASSPRLQHRVPIFVEGYDKPVKSSVDSNSATLENKKPKVRMIPIEIEGEESPSSRQRNYSGPAGMGNNQNETILRQKDVSLKRSMQDLTKPSIAKSATESKVYNIPIKVEGSGATKKNTFPKSEEVKSPVKKHSLNINDCTATKHAKTSLKEPEQEINEEQKLENTIKISMKKIEDVMEELKSYEAGVKEFNGTSRDKQYRYLDEMLTRCMLKLDDVETMGNEQVRSARKNAVKQVQKSVDLLEHKVNGTCEQNESNLVSQVEDKVTDIGMVENYEVDKENLGTGEHLQETNGSQQELLENVESCLSQVVVATEELKPEVQKSDNEISEVNDVVEVEMSETSKSVTQSNSREEIPTSPQDEEMKEIQTALGGKESNSDCEKQQNPDVEMKEIAVDSSDIKALEETQCMLQSDSSGACQSK